MLQKRELREGIDINITYFLIHVKKMGERGDMKFNILLNFE